MDLEQFEISREIKEYNDEKKTFETALRNEQIKLAQMLKGEMGQDIQNVLSGKTKVKLPLLKRIKYSIKNFFNKLFNAI